MTLHTAAPRSIVLRAGWGQLRRAGARIAYNDMRKRTHRTNTCCDATLWVGACPPRRRACGRAPIALRQREHTTFGITGTRKDLGGRHVRKIRAIKMRIIRVFHPIVNAHAHTDIRSYITIGPVKIRRITLRMLFRHARYMPHRTHIERTTKAISFHDFVARLMDNASSARRTTLAELRRKNTNDHRMPNPT